MSVKHYGRLMPALFISLSIFLKTGFCEDIGTAPAALQAALFLKILAFNNNISSGGSITIYVVKGSDFAMEMKKAEGKPIGAATLGKVVEGAGVPADKPSVVYIGADAPLTDLLAYTKGNKILSITGTPDLASKGATLAVGVSEGKPKIMLNLSSSKDEGIDWNPAILKVAATIGK
jgi:hypothetical protein